MTTFKSFVSQFTLTQEETEALWLHLLMYRLAHWRDGLKHAMGGK
jgi:hypothetical protein